MVQHRLPAPGDQRTLEDWHLLTDSAATGSSHPMWQVHFIDGYADGSAVQRTECIPSIADGITGTRSCCH